ncbi:cupin domain-containing protein [Paenibacillaceae bacterium WGS1546]|uniref:cupin domain-containing protein n=1 Tax=Cohnella sp. WGS1546 TaxID=3366810 RepID=UPI00372D3F9F
MELGNETQALLNEQATKVTAGNGAEFKIHYWGVNPRHFGNSVHRHSFFEICFVLDGEGEYSERGNDYPLRPGTHFCSRPGIDHQIRSRDGKYLLYVAFEPDERGSRDDAIEAFHALAGNGETCVYDDAGIMPASMLWKSLMLREGGRGRLSPDALRAVAGALLLSFPGLFGNEAPAPARAAGSADVLLRQPSCIFGITCPAI